MIDYFYSLHIVVLQLKIGRHDLPRSAERNMLVHALKALGFLENEENQ